MASSIFATLRVVVLPVVAYRGSEVEFPGNTGTRYVCYEHDGRSSSFSMPAFAMRDSAPPPTSNIVYDDTPIQTHMQRIHARLVEAGRASLSDFFAPGTHKSAMIGVFLAILELVRHHSVRTEQNDLGGEIWILPGDAFSADLNISDVDNYDRKPVSEEMNVGGR